MVNDVAPAPITLMVPPIVEKLLGIRVSGIRAHFRLRYCPQYLDSGLQKVAQTHIHIRIHLHSFQRKAREK